MNKKECFILLEGIKISAAIMENEVMEVPHKTRNRSTI
jgi:hypothetical protein